MPDGTLANVHGTLANALGVDMDTLRSAMVFIKAFGSLPLDERRQFRQAIETRALIVKCLAPEDLGKIKVRILDDD